MVGVSSCHSSAGTFSVTRALATCAHTVDHRLQGMTYSDLLHIWGIMRAGHIPQLISINLTDTAVVYRMLKNAGASALVYDPRFHDFLSDCSLPVYSAQVPSDMTQESPLGPVWTPSNPDDVVIIYHTSGSTSGIPKSVPLMAKGMESQFTRMGHMQRMFPSLRDQQVMVSV